MATALRVEQPELAVDDLAVLAGELEAAAAVLAEPVLAELVVQRVAEPLLDIGRARNPGNPHEGLFAPFLVAVVVHTILPVTPSRRRPRE